MALSALLFDVDGTLADTEETHRQAFNAAFIEFRLPYDWSPEQYEVLLRISGGKERLAHFFERLPVSREETDRLLANVSGPAPREDGALRGAGRERRLAAAPRHRAAARTRRPRRACAWASPPPRPPPTSPRCSTPSWAQRAQALRGDRLRRRRAGEEARARHLPPRALRPGPRGRRGRGLRGFRQRARRGQGRGALHRGDADALDGEPGLRRGRPDAAAPRRPGHAARRRRRPAAPAAPSSRSRPSSGCTRAPRRRQADRRERP